MSADQKNIALDVAAQFVGALLADHEDDEPFQGGVLIVAKRQMARDQASSECLH